MLLSNIMTRGIKCMLLAIFGFQIVLFFVYYSMKDREHASIQGIFRKSLKSKNGPKNSTAADSSFWPSLFWDMFGRGHDSERNEISTSGNYGNLVSADVTVNSSAKTVTRSGPTTTQTTGVSPKSHLKTQHFVQIDGKNAWIYSAYFDHVAAQQGRPTVRIVGIFREDLLQKLYCTFSTGNSSNLQANGSATGLPETHGRKCIASYVDCSLPVNVRPTYVSISFQKNITAVNRLQIIYPGTLIRNFTVCYSVLHSGFSSSSQLIQSLEMNRILGAEHFVVYNYSISPAVDQILQRYQQDGLVTVLPWPVPTWEVHYYGQMAAVNDCSYRNRNISRFVVYVDTDEFIIPRNSLTWMELLDTISPEEHDVSALMHPSDPSRKRLKTTGSFNFMTSFFKISNATNWTEIPSQFSFSDEEKYIIEKFKFVALSQFWRGKKIFPKNDRTKYITRPELVNTAGIHFVHSFVNKAADAVLVNVKLAIVHHYRSLSYQNLVFEMSILKFKDQLYPRLMQQCQRFPSIFR